MKTINKINPMNSIGNSVNFMILLVSCLYLLGSLLSIEPNSGAVLFDLNPSGFTIAVILMGLSIWNMSLHSEDQWTTLSDETKKIVHVNVNDILITSSSMEGPKVELVSKETIKQ